MGTTVRNDHVSICNMKEQVVIGEMIKSILNHKYEGKHFSAEYREVEAEKLELVLDWFVVEERGRVSLFMMSEFRIIVKLDPKNDNIIIMELHKIIGGLISMLNRYFDNKLLDERRIMPNRAESIVFKIIEARSEVNNNSSISVKSLPKSYIEPINQEQKTDLKPEADSVLEDQKPEQELPSKQESVTGQKNDSEDQSVSTKGDLTNKIKEYRSSFGYFLTKILLFERKFEKSKLLDLSNQFSYGEYKSGYIQTFICKDVDFAFAIEKVIRWQLDYYEESLVSRNGSLITVDCSAFFEREIAKKSTGGSFCFPPTDSPTSDEIQIRFHRICFLGDPVIKKENDYFDVRYPTSGKTQRIYDLISRMGWKSEVHKNHLFIITGPNPVISFTKNEPEEEILKTESRKESETSFTSGSESIKEEKTSVKDILVSEASVVEPSKTSLIAELKKVNSLDCIYKFSGSKKEAIEKLHEVYLDQEIFSTFSVYNQQRIFDTLQKFWIKENPEKYAVKLLEFLEN